MTEARNVIKLSAGSSYITREEKAGFLVKEGSMLVYIVPLINGRPGRRTLIFEAQAGDVVPAFMYTDEESQSLAFCFSSIAGCSIEKQDQTDEAVRRAFAEKAGIGNYETLGFNESLAELYRSGELSGSSFIKNSRRDRAETAADISGLISRNLGDRRRRIFEKTGEPLYDCAAILAALNKMALAPAARVREMYGEDYTVYDIARASQLAYRELKLEGEWYKNRGETCIVAGPGRRPMLCLPRSKGFRVLYDPETDTYTPVTRDVAANIGVKGLVFCRTLPPEKLGIADLIRFCVKGINKGELLLSFFVLLIGAWAGAAVPLAGWKMIDMFVQGGQLAEGTWKPALLLAGLTVLYAVFTVIFRLIRSKIAGKTAFDAENVLFHRVFNMPGEFFRRFDSVDLAGRILSAGAAVDAAVLYVFSGTGSLINVTAVLAAVYLCSRKLVLAGAVFTLAVVVISVLAAGFGSKYSSGSVRLEGEAASMMNQFISGISRIRSAGAEEKAVFEYLGRFIKLRESRMKYSRAGTVPALAVIGAGGACFAFGFRFIQSSTGTGSEFSPGATAAFCLLTAMLFIHAARLGRTVFRALRLKADFKRVLPLLETVPEHSANAVSAAGITGAIQLQNVSFSYSPDSPRVLSGIDLTIKAGEYIGIAGPSGCGKSTLLKLLLGFETPSSGRICYDRSDLSALDRHSLRRQTGVVLQEDRLISGNIRDNICVTAPGASEERIRSAIDAAGLKEDLEKLPMGLNTILSEDGSNVPDGVLQRILIARALINSPKILIFDEATGALDDKAEKQVLETLKSLSCTRIAVTHRLSSVRDCDRIVMLSGGRIAEQGTWQELIRSGGEFSRLARLS